MHHIILSSADGYSDCFPILAIMNNVTINMEVAGIFWYSVFICSEYVPRSEVVGLYDSFTFSSFEEPHIVFHIG